MQRSRSVKLTGKQVQILELLASGKTDNAVAIEMGRSLDTIRYHKKNIFNILSAGCTVEAIVKALKLNLISLDHVDF